MHCNRSWAVPLAVALLAAAAALAHAQAPANSLTAGKTVTVSSAPNNVVSNIIDGLDNTQWTSCAQRAAAARARRRS